MIQLTISEYGYIYHIKPNNLNDKFEHTEVTADELKEIIQYWQDNKSVRDVLEYNGDNLKAKNYVGVIQTQNISIEILPKIYNGKDTQNTRDVFISMLKVVLNINELQINKANLGVTNNKNIFEMFISLFVNSMDNLIKKGLKSSYILQEQNSNFLKGKLKFNEHIKQNYIHKERFYVQFDEYIQDRAENRLLKSTILLLLQKTKSYENKKALRQQLFIFDNVTKSKDINSDICNINIHRGMQYYDIPLQFAKVFLQHKSFTSLIGKNNVFALLFPMEKLFEEYMAIVLNNSKEKLEIDKVVINGGKNEYFLSNDKVRLQPDYLLKMKNSKDIIVDAKWKIIDEVVSSSDVYQIFAYLNYYDCQDMAYLLLPMNDKFTKSIEYKYQNINSDTNSTINKNLKIIPIDLYNISKNNHISKFF
jgi:5-methylcytosine-specific restriction enzyme subunit McrC